MRNFIIAKQGGRQWQCITSDTVICATQKDPETYKILIVKPKMTSDLSPHHPAPPWGGPPGCEGKLWNLPICCFPVLFSSPVWNLPICCFPVLFSSPVSAKLNFGTVNWARGRTFYLPLGMSPQQGIPEGSHEKSWNFEPVSRTSKI